MTLIKPKNSASGRSNVGDQSKHQPDSSRSWMKVQWQVMRDLWPGKLVLKGVVSPVDVTRARALGCDAVILSNHGGRQLDHAISPLRILSEARAQAGDMALLVDGGIRRGTDVIKALALGADMVLVGRPFLYAATLGGQDMVDHAAAILKTEMHRNLGLLGLRDLSELGPAILHPV